MTTYPENFFIVNQWLLKIAGFWKPAPSSSKFAQIAYRIYSIFIFLWVNIWYMISEFVIVFFMTDQFDLIKTINMWLSHVMGTVKIICWYFNERQLRKIMERLENKELHYEDYSNFKPGNILQKFKQNVINYAIFFTFLTHAIILSSYTPLLSATIKYIHSAEPDGNSTTVALPQRLPFNCWIPFPNDGGYTFIFSMVYQAVAMLIYSYTIAGVDFVFINSVNCISGNLTIIEGALLTLKARCQQRLINRRLNVSGINQTKELMREMNIELRKIIKHLQVLFSLCDEMECVYRYITLSQSAATLFIICTCLYLISTIPLMSKQILAEFLYLGAVLWQFFLFCWFGNEATLKFQDLPYYFWKSDWLTTEITYKKHMLFNMLRAKNPIFFTAGKLVPLTLNTFVMILKSSYSVFAVLKNTST